ncbi:MAG: DinB family protein [bacterium]
MKAIELFPYWADNRALLAETIAPLREHDLKFRPADGLLPLGDILRHILTTEEYWWHGGILGEPFEAWRTAGWEAFTPDQEAAYRAGRFPTLSSIREGLETVHAPVAQFLTQTDAALLCEKRRATWGEDNTLRWIFWHLVEHDQHHRAQVFTRLRMLGYTPPSMFPRPAVMGMTPATGWQSGDEEIGNIVPFWDRVRRDLRGAVAGLSERDLAFRPAGTLPSVHDLILHIFTWEDFLIRQNLRGDIDRAWWKIEGSVWQIPVASLAQHVGDQFPTIGSLVEGLDTVADSTRSFVNTLPMQDLPKVHATPWGPQTVHHTVWYAREHMVHHRAQLFLRMRMLGRTPPDI